MEYGGKVYHSGAVQRLPNPSHPRESPEPGNEAHVWWVQRKGQGRAKEKGKEGRDRAHLWGRPGVPGWEGGPWEMEDGPRPQARSDHLSPEVPI